MADAEAAGAAGLWACDHLFWHRPLLDPLSALAVAATASTTATLGTCVLQLPLRSSAAVARQAHSLQLLSGGRFVLGLGVGSHPGEYEAAGVDYQARGRLLDEGIGAMREAWSSGGEPGRRYRLDPPALPIPIWVAGASKAALRRAARVGDGWVPLFLAPAQYADARRRLCELAEEAGRDPDGIVASVVVVLRSGVSADTARAEGARWLADLYGLPPKAFDRHVIAGPPEQCATVIDAYHQVGADHVVVMVAGEEPLDHFGPVADTLGVARSRPAAPIARLEPLGAVP